ncbi:unnamed protein product [Plutella xylostella]|uniref:(diamondback moth) hypothetical protein n=1 Tax=Plutella xylostella TaxID=51655 RepID=A0A8S4FY51_PLUXY|nr:unnamed protein product [Plutella xylostella]
MMLTIHTEVDSEEKLVLIRPGKHDAQTSGDEDSDADGDQ